MQKRLVRKLDLEKALAQIKPHPTPTPGFEQYTIPASMAATILRMAAYSYPDIIGKTVIDLGCGTGRLDLGAAILGAEDVVGIDIDRPSVIVARDNACRLGLSDRMQWIAGDIEAIRGHFNTVLENPPFGVQQPKSDRRFLEKALSLGEVVYSLHKDVMPDKGLVAFLKGGSSRLATVKASSFLEGLINDHGGRIRAVYAMLMTIPHMFDFHTKKEHCVVVDLYVIESARYLAEAVTVSY